jgi:cell division cycle 20-like protein 1 (cofactor of APC complex)
MVRSLRDHGNRVGATAWQGSLIASGSKDRNICVRDLRAPGPCVQKLIGHRQEVCGLRWSPHDEMMLASGGNDNKLMLWQVGHSNNPLIKFGQHTAAVKAINWSPLHRGLLATGGGTAD